MKHPADMKPEEKAMYDHGFSHFDSLSRLGYSYDDTKLYVQGLRERMNLEEWRALHPQFFKD